MSCCASCARGGPCGGGLGAFLVPPGSGELPPAFNPMRRVLTQVARANQARTAAKRAPAAGAVSWRWIAIGAAGVLGAILLVRRRRRR